MRSDSIKKGVERTPHRSLLKADGFTEEEINRPFIGVVCAKNEIIPGHIQLDKIAEAVKAGIRLAGGTPIEFPSIGVCDLCLSHTALTVLCLSLTAIKSFRVCLLPHQDLIFRQYS